ncbi:MAG: hypothetical protein J5727_02545 [Kiritimatiellae bacterium]|nr:hypothetical protein [Kiritimatiellia bacterium]
MNNKTMKFAIAGIAAFFAAMVTGCASVEYSSPGRLQNVTVKGAPGAEAGQHVAITTSGYNLFWYIPLASGDLRWDEEKRDIKGGFSLFSDQVGFQELQTALQNIAEVRNCDLADVVFHDSDGFYTDVSWGGLIGTCFGSSQMGVSAILIPRENIAK